MKGRFIYEWMAEEGTVPQRKLPSAGLSVFDPCRSRDEPSLQEAVRILSGRSGAELVPLPEEGKEARCCSWGGHVSIANPDFAEKQTNARITQSGLPYIAYCANCRDIFADAGKECIHIFDLLFNLGDGTRPAPGCTERQVNREKLKNLALNMFWDEQNPVPEGRDTILVMDEPVRRKLSADRILEDEAAAAAAYCEKDRPDGDRSENGQPDRQRRRRALHHLGDLSAGGRKIPAAERVQPPHAYSQRGDLEWKTNKH